jgi:hypothetical protein
VCDAFLLKVKYVSFCDFNGLLAFIDWVYKVIFKAHLKCSILMIYKTSTSSFCQAFKSHSTPNVRMVHNLKYNYEAHKKS